MAPRPHFEEFVTVPVDDDGDDENVIKSLVLVGGGHGHVQVIKALAARPDNLCVILIDKQEAASYSGMVPGTVARFYKPEDSLLHLAPLAEWADIPFVQKEVVDIELDKRNVRLSDKTEIAFDAISIDIGSTTRALNTTPGALKYTIPTRPIDALVRRIEESENELNEDRSVHVLVVGAGIAGLELAMSIHGRWKTLCKLKVTVLDASCRNGILPSETDACRRNLLEILEVRNIALRYECGVARVEKNRVVLNNTESIAFDFCIWATGAAAHDLAHKLAERGLATDEHGWIKVNENLQSVSHPFVFAAGDCASHPANPPKAGVYAVRSGPVLIQNLTAYLRGERELAVFKPQDDFLKLLACGDGTSLGFRFGIPIHGKWVWEMKDRIDNAFMNLFKVENLPVERADKLRLYDVSQYDASYACKEHDNLVEASEAAAILWRNDPGVDTQQAWKILRDMVCMKEYRAEVLKQWHSTEALVLQATTLRLSD